MAPRVLVDRFGSFFDSTDGQKGTYARSDSGESLDVEDQQRRRRSKRRIKHDPKVTLPLLVLIDMFAVSLVVPLLFQYYKQAGITSANQRELLSSLFSTAQIVGGLLMGVVTDARLVSRHTILRLSFGGSALSYLLIVYGGLHSLLFSRVLVGLVKQTMTVTTTMLSKCTNKENRAKYMGRLSAASTVAWIVGPSAGAMLYHYWDHRAPALLASALFVLNLILSTILLPEDPEEETKEHSRKLGTSVMSNLRSCFSSKTLGSIVATKLIFTWVTKATSFSQLGSFYEDMYGLDPHHRGYISSYQQLLQFLVQATLVGPIMAHTGGERQAVSVFTALIPAVVFVQSSRSLWLFLLVLCPLCSLSHATVGLSLQSLVTHEAPQTSLFSVLAALDVLQNFVSVSVPFYRTFLFRFLDQGEGDMAGDPDPVEWMLASAVHWLVAALAIGALLLWTGRETKLVR